MTAPLLPFDTPLVGDGCGVPQLLLGESASMHTGAPTTLLRVPTPRNRDPKWVLTVELEKAAADAFRQHGKPSPPTWPLVEASPQGDIVWDGRTSVRRAEGVAVGNIHISWVEDHAGIHAAVVAKNGMGSPNDLAEALFATGAVGGWADRDGHRRRWLLDNIAVVAPWTEPPTGADETELFHGLAALSGWGNVTALRGAGAPEPLPHVSPVGTVEFSRIAPATVPDRLDGTILVHRVAPGRNRGGIIDVVESGVLLSRRRRRMLGIPGPTGWGSSADDNAGSAGLVFAQPDESDAVEPMVALIWTRPDRFVRRLDAVAVPHDPVERVHVLQQRVNPKFVLDPTLNAVDDPTAPFPQVAVHGAVDIVGPHGPDRIVVPDEGTRLTVLRHLEQKRVRTLAGTPLDTAVRVSSVLAEMEALGGEKVGLPG